MSAPRVVNPRDINLLELVFIVVVLIAMTCGFSLVALDVYSRLTYENKLREIHDSTLTIDWPGDATSP